MATYRRETMIKMRKFTKGMLIVINGAMFGFIGAMLSKYLELTSGEETVFYVTAGALATIGMLYIAEFVSVLCIDSLQSIDVDRAWLVHFVAAVPVAGMAYSLVGTFAIGPAEMSVIGLQRVAAVTTAFVVVLGVLSHEEPKAWVEDRLPLSV